MQLKEEITMVKSIIALAYLIFVRFMLVYLEGADFDYDRTIKGW